MKCYRRMLGIQMERYGAQHRYQKQNSGSYNYSRQHKNTETKIIRTYLPNGKQQTHQTCGVSSNVWKVQKRTTVQRMVGRYNRMVWSQLSRLVAHSTRQKPMEETDTKSGWLQRALSLRDIMSCHIYKTTITKDAMKILESVNILSNVRIIGIDFSLLSVQTNVHTWFLISNTNRLDEASNAFHLLLVSFQKLNITDGS